MNEVYYGVLVSLCANISITVGHHVKRVDTDSNPSLTKLDHGKTRIKRRSFKDSCGSLCNGKKLQYILGQCLFFGGTLASAYSLAYAPQTLLASIGSIQFVTNLVCSKIFHGNRVTLWNIIGTFGVIIGCLFIVFGFSAHGQQTKPPTINELFQNYNTPQYTAYVIITLIIASSTLICGMFCGSGGETSAHLPRKKTLGHLTNNGKVSCLDLKRIEHYWIVFSGVIYAICSAMPGTLSVVLGKTLAIITRHWIGGKLSYDTFNIIFITVVFISFSATQIYWMVRYNRSMQKFDPVFILPLNQVMWITFSTVAGGLYFREFENANLFQVIALIGGLTINFVGLFLLVRTPKPVKKLISNMDLKLKMKTKSKNKNKTKKPKNTNGNTNGKPTKRQNINNLDHRSKNNRMYRTCNIKKIEKTTTTTSPTNTKSKSKSTTTICINTNHKINTNTAAIAPTTITTAKTPLDKQSGSISAKLNENHAITGTRESSMDASLSITTTTTTTTAIATNGQAISQNSSKYASFVTHWIHNAYNIVKDAMLSPSIQSPSTVELLENQSEPLLNHRESVPNEIKPSTENYKVEDDGHKNSDIRDIVNLKLNLSLKESTEDIPLLPELDTHNEEIESVSQMSHVSHASHASTHFTINMDNHSFENDRFDNYINNKKFRKNNNVDSNRKNLESDGDYDDDSELSSLSTTSSSSVCLHDSPVMTSSDTN